MNFHKYNRDIAAYLAQAAEMLGEPAQPLWVKRSVRNAVAPQLTWEATEGLGEQPPWYDVLDNRRGHGLRVGMSLYRWQYGSSADDAYRLVQVVVPQMADFCDFWMVPVAQYRRIYRRLRSAIRQDWAAAEPILDRPLRDLLWNNTIGLLTKSHEVLEQYNVAVKRGVLLLGEPGNGKTMATRWLAGACRRHGLEWRNVTLDEYRCADSNGTARELFDLSTPGIVMFDDFDQALQDRRTSGQTPLHSTFLTELDGFRPKHGVVYLFTTNRELTEIDPAMRRPGRIDVSLHFPRPSIALRQRMIHQTWQADIVAAVDVNRVVADSEGFSFAELEETRRMMVMSFLDTGTWDWPAACRQMVASRRAACPQPRIGFSVTAESAVPLPATSAGSRAEQPDVHLTEWPEDSPGRISTE